MPPVAFGGPRTIEHPNASHFRKTKDGQLLIKRQGETIGRYRKDRWLDVRLVDEDE